MSQNRIAIVTGGASGMGEASALELSKRNYTVIVADVDDKKGPKVAEKCGKDSEYYHLDVSVYAEWEALVAKVVKKHGAIHFLLNCAGITTDPTPILDASVDEFDKIMRINGNSVFYGCKACGPELIKQGPKASVINVSSDAAMVGGFGSKPGYYASKGAVRSVTKNIALSWAEHGVRVNSLHPGFIETPLLRAGTTTDTSIQKMIEGIIPMKRIGKVEEIAKVVAFYASDDASYITGSEIVVDGGYIAQ